MIYLLRIFEIGLLFLHIFRICFVNDYLYLIFWFFDMNIYLHISYILLISLSYRIIPYLVVFCCIFLGFFLWIFCIFVLLLFELFQMFFLQIFIFFLNPFLGWILLAYCIYLDLYFRKDWNLIAFLLDSFFIENQVVGFLIWFYCYFSY
jgi:hypothetical protein